MLRARTLIKRETVTLPAGGCNMPWPARIAGVICISRPAAARPVCARPGLTTNVTAFKIDPTTGALSPHGPPIKLPTAPDPHQHGHSVREQPGCVQQSECGARLPYQQGLHAGRRSDPAGSDRRRPSSPIRCASHRTIGRWSWSPAATKALPTKAEDPGRTEGVRLQERRADERSLGRAERRQGIRPATPRFSSEQALDVRVDRDAEQDGYGSDGEGPDRRGHRVPRGHARRSRTTSGRVKLPARCTSIRTAASSTEPIARRTRSNIRASRCSKAAKQHRGIRGQPVQRRAETDPAHRDPEDATRGHFIFTRADASWWPQHNLPVDVRDGDKVKTLAAGLSVFRMAMTAS